MDKKYTSLEHAIRNIVTETIGVTGKSEPEGTPRSFLKPVGVISPPKGAAHPGTKKTATILAQRGEDKVQHALKEQSSKSAKKEEEGESWDPASETTPDEKTKREAAKKKADKDKVVGGELPKGMKPSGELTSREPLPTEKLTAGLEKLYGDSREARERVEKIGKAASALSMGLTDIAGSGVDSAALAKRGEYGAAAKEFTAGVALPLAGGAVLGKFGSKVIKQGDQAKLSPVIKRPELGTKIQDPLKNKIVSDIMKRPDTLEAPANVNAKPTPVEVSPPRTATYQSVNKAAPIGARTPAATVTRERIKPSTSASRLSRVGPMGDGPTYAPKDAKVKTGAPKGPGGGGGGGATTTVPQTPSEKVVSFKPPTDTTPSNAPTAQLKTGASAAPKIEVKPPEIKITGGNQGRGKPKAYERNLQFKPETINPVAVKTPGLMDTIKSVAGKTLSNVGKAMEKINLPVAVATTLGQGSLVTPESDLGKKVSAYIDAKKVQNAALKQAETGFGKETGAAAGGLPSAPTVPKPGITTIPTPTAPEAVPQKVTRPYTDVNAPPQIATQPTIDPKSVQKHAAELKPQISGNKAEQPATQLQLKPDELKKQTETQKEKNRKGRDQKTRRQQQGRGRGRLPFGLKIPGVSPDVLSGLRGFVPAHQYVHFEPQGFMENSEADNIRKTIENVARPGGKTRIAKQGEIKAKIIDENAKRAAVIKKTVKDSTIIRNPKLKHPELDEN